MNFKGNMSELLTLSKEDADSYGEKISKFGSIWCCVQAPVGHIW